MSLTRALIALSIASSPAALAAALNRLLANPAWAESLGAAGRRRVAEYFTQDRMVTAIEAVYRRVLETPL